MGIRSTGSTLAVHVLPAGDDGTLGLRRPLPDTRLLTGDEPYEVVHPGTSVPARAWPPRQWAETVRLLRSTGRPVVVTDSLDERTLTSTVAGAHGLDPGGATGLAELADELDRPDAVLVANAGPAHRAAAVGTAVVVRWRDTPAWHRSSPRMSRWLSAVWRSRC